MADNVISVLPDYDPIFGTGGNKPADHGDIEHCYNLLLGRSPESIDIIRQNLDQPVHAIFRDMIASDEFSEIFALFTSGKMIRHYSLRGTPDDDLLFWFNKQFIIDNEFSRSVLASRKWEDVLRLLTSRPEFSVLIKKGHQKTDSALALPEALPPTIDGDSNDVTCFLDDCSPTRVQGWAAYGGSPERSVLLKVLVNGEVFSEFLSDLPRPDLMAAGYPLLSGFKFQLPRRYFDGKQHVLAFFADDKQVGVHIKGQLYATHIFEGLWVPPLRSNVDGFDRGVIKGWALRATADSEELKGGLTIRVMHKDETVATLKANRFRPDVGRALSADNYCGFIFDPPYHLRRSSPLAFSFYDVLDGSELSNSPCSTSFGQDHREGKLLALQDTLERLNSDFVTIKEELKSLISRKHYTVDDYDMWFRDYVKALRSRVSTKRDKGFLEAGPLVSVICPTFRPDLDDFIAAIQSVIDQTYKNWELIIVDDGSDDNALTACIKNLERHDRRIKFITTLDNLGIGGATNLAIDSASGEWIALFDHDDLLVDVALEVMVSEAIVSGAKILYSDEDKIDPNGYFSEPAFKPDWNYRLLLSSNYICHLLVVRTDLLRAVGKLRSKYDGAQDHDLILRLSEAISDTEVLHVPEVLYHWRKTAKSTASGISAKTYAIDAGVNAISDHLARMGKSAKVTSVLSATMYCVTWQNEHEPLVHIIVPFRDQASMTAKCLDAVLRLTRYGNFRVTLVDNWSNKAETAEMVRRYTQDPRVGYLRVEEEFNYSRLNNQAADLFESEFIFLMNNDLVVLDEDWLNIVVNEALADSSVGAVGGKFLYPNGTVQHAGVVLGLWGVAGHVHVGLDAEAPGYAARAILAHEVSAVTAAGMLVRTDLFRKVGQFDEVNLKVAFNDIDLCMKIRGAGYKIIWTPAFCAEHYESLSRGHDDKSFKKARFDDEINSMKNKWGHSLKTDVHFSKFFDLFGEPFFDLIDPNDSR